MDKMESSGQTLKTSQLINRLVVLIPVVHQVDEPALGRQVRLLAYPNKSSVLYLTVIQSYDDEMPALHRLTRLTAITHGASLRADLHVIYAKSWLTAIRRLYQPGDLLVCFSGHQVNSGWLRRVPLETELSNKMHLPVWVLNNGQEPVLLAGG